jgi:DNA polymerase III subunit delta
MSEPAPLIYLLHGEDDFAIAEFVSTLENELGDPTVRDMNVLSVASAMPFLAPRRLVILTNPVARLSGQQARKRFLDQLEKISPSTTLVLIEERVLTSEKDRRQKKLHWLEEWAEKSRPRVRSRIFAMPQGEQMIRWIQAQAVKAGGQITPLGAEQLVSLVGADPRLAVQEIAKLLAYVNYRRPVDEDDVNNLTADVGQGDIFSMVDALGNMDGRSAMRVLQKLLEQKDLPGIFGMIVRQFRLLILTREILNQGGQREMVSKKLALPPFVADKLIVQARRLDMTVLETIYRRLLELDKAIKSSQVDGPLALDILVAELTHS